VTDRVYDFDKAPECTWEYLVDLGRDNKVLNANTPFRFLNHSCTPNCRLNTDGYKAWLIALACVPKI